jgi:hypothetical protein
MVAGPLVPKLVAACRFYHGHTFRLGCAVMLKILTCDGDALIIEPPAAGNPQPPWPLKRVK